MHILHCTDHCVQHDRWVVARVLLVWWYLAEREMVEVGQVGSCGFEMVWDGLSPRKSRLQCWGLKQMIPWKPNNSLLHPFTFNFVGCPSNIALGYLRLIFFRPMSRTALAGLDPAAAVLGPICTVPTLPPSTHTAWSLGEQWSAMLGNRGIWLVYYGLFGRIWMNLDEFGGCSTDVLLAPPVILACSIVRYCSSIVCLPLRRLRMMLFDIIRNISWHQEEFVRGFLWFLDVSWCFVLPTWEFHRDSPSTPHQRLTNAAPTPHQGNRCTTVFGGLIQSQRCTWFAAFHCVPWHRKIAKRSEKESLPYVSSWCFMFHDVSLKIFKIYLCDSCDCDVLWYLINSYNIY